MQRPRAEAASATQAMGNFGMLILEDPTPRRTGGAIRSAFEGTKRIARGATPAAILSSALSTAALSALLLAAPTAWAADEAQVLRARAARLAEANDCAAALPLLERATAADPAGEASTRLLTGRCLLAEKRFDEAAPLLEAAAEADPASGEAALALGMVRYHQGNAAGARSELERAERMLPNRPEAPLYLGLILLEAEEAKDAAARFDRAGALSADGFDPVSSYYAAVAHANAGNAEEAEASLSRVQELGAGTPYAERATEALERAEARRTRGGPLQRWVTLQSGLDYDTNVSIRNDQVANPTNLSGNKDGRGWWALDVGADLFRKDGWSAGTGASYSGNAYFDSGDFNQHYVTGRFWLGRRLGENTQLVVTPEGGLGYLGNSLNPGDNKFLRFAGARPEIRHDFGRAGTGSLYARYAYNDFQFNRLAERLDRDGHDIRFGYDHLVSVVEQKTTLRGGVFGRHYIAEGTEYDHSGVGAWLGLSQALPWKFTLDLSGSFAYDNYDDISQFVIAGDPPNTSNREDYIGTAGAVLSRPITSWLSASARWNYLNSESNTPVFDYDRHIVGAFFTIRFAEPGGLFWGNNS